MRVFKWRWFLFSTHKWKGLCPRLCMLLCMQSYNALLNCWPWTLSAKGFMISFLYVQRYSWKTKLIWRKRSHPTRHFQWKTRKVHCRPIRRSQAACEGWITGSAKETCRNLQRLLNEVIKDFFPSFSWAVPSVEWSFLTILLVTSGLQIPLGSTMKAFCSTKLFSFSIDILKSHLVNVIQGLTATIHFVGMRGHSVSADMEFDHIGHCAEFQCHRTDVAAVHSLSLDPAKSFVQFCYIYILMHVFLYLYMWMIYLYTYLYLCIMRAF